MTKHNQEEITNALKDFKKRFVQPDDYYQGENCMRGIKKWNDMYIDNVVDWQMQVMSVAKMHDIECNPVQMYQAFYAQHKATFGSYRLLKGVEYLESMQQRYEWAMCQMNDFLEGRIEFQKKYGKIDKEL